MVSAGIFDKTPETRRIPFFAFLIVLLIAGLLTFRDYGSSWDEPLFYAYADALGYAYTPANWLSGHFDLNLSYGPSGDDHKTRGPAYLLLAREPAYLFEKFGVDTASGWHLINFLTFLLGVYFLYRICECFTRPWAALAASALFMFQPLLWGHAFINPKDPPFLVFLTGSIYLGWRMVDHLADSQGRSAGWIALRILLPAFFLGITTSIRVLGPLAGLLVLIYFLARRPTRRAALWMSAYGLLAIAITLATWPYLWENPPARFAEVFHFMSDNPTVLPVLFGGQLYHAYDLPRRYLPFYLFFTLTEPVWPLCVLGLIAGYRRLKNDGQKLVPGMLLPAWFLTPFLYAILRRPPVYDGMRHFLFILPPIFIFAGIAFDFLFEKINRNWINATLLFLALAPGLVGMIRLHPYEYTYYNSFIGGTGGAFRRYETEYWLTCYKEAVLQFNRIAPRPATLYVHREAYVAAPYAAGGITVLDERGNLDQVDSGDYLLVNTRSNEDRQTFHDAPTLLSVGREGAAFCVIKQIP